MQYAIYSICEGAPLVFVLHGFCERNNPKAITNRLPAWLRYARNVSVVAPVLVRGLWNETQVNKLISQVQKDANASSVRLVGISIGGSAAWNLIAMYPNLYESAVIIAASPGTSFVLDALLRLFGLAIKREQQSNTSATHVIAVNGVMDPLFCFAKIRLPPYAVKLRFWSRGHQVTDLA